MTKKDYELFANEINKHMMSHKPETINRTLACVELVDLTAKIFALDNPAFKADKYKQACYEGKHIRTSIKGCGEPDHECGCGHN